MEKTRSPVQARINLVKILLIFPIIIFHSFVGLIGIEKLTTEPKFHTWNTLIQIFGNSFFASFGFFITCLSLFTYGYHSDQAGNSKKNIHLFKGLLLFLCMVGSQFDFSLSPSDPDFFAWDLYSFILTIIVTLYFLKQFIVHSPKRWFFIFVALFLVTPLANNFLISQLHLSLLQILLPVQVTSNSNSWFLLPWIFAPLLFFAAGAQLKSEGLGTINLFTLLGASGVAVLFFMIVKPFYYPFSLEIDATYMNFFWQHASVNVPKVFLFCVFMLVLCSKRFSFLESNFFLKKLRFLQWCKHFWLCYILHLGIKDIIADMYPEILQTDFILSYIWLFIFLASELLAQMFFASLIFYKFLYRELIAKLRLRNA